MAKKSEDYLALQAELDAILETLHHDDTGVDSAVRSYERGMEIIRQLEAHLQAAENKVTKLRASFEEV